MMDNGRYLAFAVAAPKYLIGSGWDIRVGGGEKALDSIHFDFFFPAKA